MGRAGWGVRHEKRQNLTERGARTLDASSGEVMPS